MTNTATMSELISIPAAAAQFNFPAGAIEAAIAAKEIEYFNTPRGKMVRQADTVALRQKTLGSIL